MVVDQAGDGDASGAEGAAHRFGGGKKLGDELAVGRDVRGVAGATLSASATAGAARRVLALHRVLAERTPALGSKTE